MTTQVLNSYAGAGTLEELLNKLNVALADASLDRHVEGQGRRVHPSEIYLAPSTVDLLRERLEDGSYVYNLRIKTL